MSDVRTTAVLKTDLRSSTPLFHTFDGDALRQFLEDQKRLVSQLVQDNKGQIIKGEGDAFWVIFPSVTAAAQTAVQIQKALRAQQAGKFDQDRIALRIAITAGDILHHANDIFGTAVNLAARIEGITPADDIYLSHAAALLINQAEIEIEKVGEFALKGFVEPQTIYKVAQSQRTILLPPQIILSADIGRFNPYQKTASMAEIENLLWHFEKSTKTISEQHDGIIRLLIGDMGFVTFTRVEAALTAVADLRRLWDTFTETNAIPCPLRMGLHWGEMAIFRLFAYGNDLYTTISLSNVSRPQVNSTVVVSHAIWQLAQETRWQNQFQRLAPDIASDERLHGMALYEFL